MADMNSTHDIVSSSITVRNRLYKASVCCERRLEKIHFQSFVYKKLLKLLHSLEPDTEFTDQSPDEINKCNNDDSVLNSEEQKKYQWLLTEVKTIKSKNQSLTFRKKRTVQLQDGEKNDLKIIGRSIVLGNKSSCSNNEAKLVSECRSLRADHNTKMPSIHSANKDEKTVQKDLSLSVNNQNEKFLNEEKIKRVFSDLPDQLEVKLKECHTSFKDVKHLVRESINNNSGAEHFLQTLTAHNSSSKEKPKLKVKPCWAWYPLPYEFLILQTKSMCCLRSNNKDLKTLIDITDAIQHVLYRIDICEEESMNLLKALRKMEMNDKNYLNIYRFIYGLFCFEGKRYPTVIAPNSAS